MLEDIFTKIGPVNSVRVNMTYNSALIEFTDAVSAVRAAQVCLYERETTEHAFLAYHLQTLP